MGSHLSYSKRYPDSFSKFKGNNDKEETIAEYDNSILYNDFIVDSLLNIIKSNIPKNNNSITSAIYLSDHGENVYDEFNRTGHDFSNILPKSNVEVPFIVWLSPSYTQLCQDKTELIKANINKAYVTNDLFHSILDLTGILCPYLEEDKSIFNEKYKENHHRILEDGKDYDKM
jgi:heptose-I-phosphate ethanolaminephosphotransferase